MKASELNKHLGNKPNLAFKKAKKEQSKLRLAIFGPSGSGKTYSSLRIASGMSDKIAVIDTERGSASKYADRFNFDTLQLEDFEIDTYVSAINAANAEDYQVLIIDSLTHAWQDLLEEVERVAQAKFNGNTWSAWSTGTPKQTSLVNAILSFNGHIIATMRTKTEWTIEKDQNGRTKPTRVGLSPQQGKGIEYEFDLLIEIGPTHVANCIKDRTGRFQDQVIKNPSENLGKELMTWLSEGIPPRHWSEDENNRIQLIQSVNKLGYTEQDLFTACAVDAWEGMRSIESGRIALDKLKQLSK